MAQVTEANQGAAAQPPQAPLDEHLGLGAGHEDTGTDRELEVAKRRDAGEVLQRYPGGGVVGSRPAAMVTG